MSSCFFKTCTDGWSSERDLNGGGRNASNLMDSSEYQRNGGPVKNFAHWDSTLGFLT